jgi:pilus assembly protein CpaB
MQQRRAIVFFGLALLLACAAVLAARSILERPVAEAGPATVQTAPVVVARADVQTGSALAGHQVDTVDWPVEYLPKGSFRKPEDVEGRVLRRALAAGEPVLEPTLMPEGTKAGLVSVIEDKKRAVSVKVDPIIGVAGFVQPGARVDVLATLRRIDLANKIPYSKVILQDIPVLAIDQQLEDSRNAEPELVSVVTLEVSPEDAEKLIYGAHEGRLQLALRSPADRDLVKTASIGVVDLLSVRRKARPRRTSGPSVEVLTGTQRSVKQF